jgi:hypothetical protein
MADLFLLHASGEKVPGGRMRGQGEFAQRIALAQLTLHLTPALSPQIAGRGRA